VWQKTSAGNVAPGFIYGNAVGLQNVICNGGKVFAMWRGGVNTAYFVLRTQYKYVNPSDSLLFLVYAQFQYSYSTLDSH
jgi:hypothetical protein